MADSLMLPEGFSRRFAIVKLWPNIKTAEDECISRLKIAAEALDLECIEIHADGTLIHDHNKKITNTDVDFVIHLHYDTPKLYDAFSFVALWNPLSFYHEWGYSRCSRNLISHDDFLSCSSDAADDHVSRMIRNASTHLPPKFNLYHSISDVVNKPTLGEAKLFYAGINWEALGKGKSRHQDVLKKLDQTGKLKIFGPKKFQGVQVWKGYKSYIKEIPFDGFSMLEEISRAGIALVLSSQAHKDSELMSNRLFESIAAGALIICDENKFARKYFGDSLLYVDMRLTEVEICERILSHINWAVQNEKIAIDMISTSQKIFREKFNLKKNLFDLYTDFSTRKETLLKLQGVFEAEELLKVKLVLLLNDFNDSVFMKHLENICVQNYKNFDSVLVIDKVDYEKHSTFINEKLNTIDRRIELLPLNFYEYGPGSEIKAPRKLGGIIQEIIDNTSLLDAVVFLAPNEQIFSNHLQILAGSLVQDSKRQCVATSSILKNGKSAIHAIFEKIDFQVYDKEFPFSFGRFIFRSTSIPKDLKIALPYLHKKTIAALVGDAKIFQVIPSTIVINTTHEFPNGDWNEAHENEVLKDFTDCLSFRVYNGKNYSSPCIAPQVSLIGTVKRGFKWISGQIYALRKQGIISRVQAAKKKLKK